jgi:DNA replication protein DnaC
VNEENRRRLAELVARGKARLDDPVFRAHVAEGEAVAREAERGARRIRRKYAGIPVALAELLDGDLEPTAALEKARAFLSSPKLLLVFAGDVGRGKSLAAAWLADMMGGRFVEAADVVQANVYDAQGWRSFFTPPLLAIDELGMEPLDQGGWGESKFYDLVNGRLQAKKRTVLVTNLDLKAFVARYPDPRLRDRLRAHGAFLVAKGPSMRGADGTVPPPCGNSSPSDP